MEQVEKFQAKGIKMDNLREMMGEREDQTTLLPSNPDEDDAMLFNCTVAWSYEGEITTESILEKPDQATAVVLERMHQLYDISEESRKN